MHRALSACVASLALVVIASAGAGRKCGHGQYGHGGGSTPAPPNLSEAPVAHTPSGAVRGAWLYTRRGRPVEAYRGVRYAAPPVGDLRFQPPQPLSRPEAEVDARAEGPACPQPTLGDYEVHEDCLRLNVYTPRKTGKLLPVVVYLHAGGFYSLSGRSDVAGPDYLLDEDLVLVTVNYRLASLGFLSTGDALAPGNNGFKDQVTSLRWVRRHIASFGGDPALVTLAGYSAGSFSVMLHMVSPMSRGLFHRAISMSGSPISQVALPHHQKELAIKQAELLSCPTDSSKAIIDCLKTKTSVELGDSLYGFFEYAYDPVLLWIPIIEKDFGQERFLVEHPLTSLKEGRFHAVPYIVTQTQDEFFWKAFSILDNETLTHQMDTEWHRMAAISFYLPPPPPAPPPPPGPEAAADTLRAHYLGDGRLVNDSETAANLGKLYSDAIIGFGVHTLANAMAVYSPQPVYYYEFAYRGNNSHFADAGRPRGAAHHDDLIYLFSINASFPPVEVSASRDSRQVDRMTRMWHTFATTGNPSPSPSPPEAAPAPAVAWPRMTHARRRYLRVDADYSVRENLFEDRFQVWERLYSPEGCSYCTY